MAESDELNPGKPYVPRSAIYRIALLQFVTFAGRGIVYPFISLYLISIGFSGTQIGLLTSVSALAQLSAAPLLHALADRYGRQRRLYYGLVIGNIAACLGAVLIPGSQLWLSTMIVLRDASDMPSVTLLSQLTITWLQQQRRQIFGQIRAWGSFGWAVTTVLAGRIAAVAGYPPLFVLSALANLILLPQLTILPRQTAQPHERSAALSSRPRGLYILLASVFLYYVGASAFSAFSSIYFKRTLGASDELIGLTSSLAALSEIPAMLLIDRVLRRVDIRATLMVGICGLGALWFGSSQLTGTTLLIPLMLMRGTFFTLQIISITLLVSRISHASNVATNQVLTQVTIPGLAILLTGSLNGWLFDHIGARALFQLAALLAVLSTGLLIVARKALASRPTEALSDAA